MNQLHKAAKRQRLFLVYPLYYPLGASMLGIQDFDQEGVATCLPSRVFTKCIDVFHRCFLPLFFLRYLQPGEISKSKTSKLAT